MNEPRVAIIGGSGFYDMEGITEVDEVEVGTPFGSPSDAIRIGTLDGQRVAFLPRHGRGHRLLPSEVPSRANVFALKSIGVERVIAVSAVGSMREEIRPLDLVIPDQLFDRTKARPLSFFGEGIVAHVSFADPFCPHLSAVLGDACERVGAQHHRGGTYICIEGPQFSTRAESRIYRQWGVDVIGMTAVPEAKLAREAELCYGLLALATDYDVWHESAEEVSVEMVVGNLLKNVDTAKAVVRTVLASLGEHRPCGCDRALKDAIMTRPDAIPAHAREALAPLIGKYVQ